MKTLSPRQRQILAAARRCLGTPFTHQGRLPGVGLDCVGLLVTVARECGFANIDCDDYKRRPGAKKLRDELPKSMDEIPVADAEEGDVLAFWVRKPGNVQHVAIITDRGIIHTQSDIDPSTPASAVVEHSLGEPWCSQIESAWRFR